MKHSVVLVFGGVLGIITSAPALFGQACYNGAVVGVYGFVGSRPVAATATTPGPGTGSGSTTSPSTTPIGVLLGDINGTTGFGVVGALSFDGAGTIFAMSNPAANSQPPVASTEMQVGTYNVSLDCTITVTLNDVFAGMPVTPPGTAGAGAGTGSNTPPSTTTPSTTTPSTATFEGVVANGGNEIDLAEAKTSTGVAVVLRKMFQTVGCTNASLTGAYDFSAQIFIGLPLTAPGTSGTTPGTGGTSPGTGGTSPGTGATTGTTPATFPTVARFFANGAGMFTTDSFSQQSSLVERQLTGTYTVNTDCTGTATFTSNGGVSETANFVLVRPLAASQVMVNGACAVSTIVEPDVLFDFTTSGVQGFATARPLQ
ncbi:MAG TPA: hypothetical protein VMT32_14455 [Bryobacteraceae bacterium]|nr:hypothetical protein [Bryobacteraceae bacterium]